MDSTMAEPYTLRTLRHASGLKMEAVVERGREHVFRNFLPKSAAHLSMIEQRGTTNYFVIMALADIYQKPHTVIAAAASSKNI